MCNSEALLVDVLKDLTPVINLDAYYAKRLGTDKYDGGYVTLFVIATYNSDLPIFIPNYELITKWSSETQQKVMNFYESIIYNDFGNPNQNYFVNKNFRYITRSQFSSPDGLIKNFSLALNYNLSSIELVKLIYTIQNYDSKNI